MDIPNTKVVQTDRQSVTWNSDDGQIELYKPGKDPEKDSASVMIEFYDDYMLVDSSIYKIDNISYKKLLKK